MLSIVKLFLELYSCVGDGKADLKLNIIYE